MKSAKKPGRPRLYDPKTALAAASDVFGEFGHSAATLDRLSEATGMARPSLYAAFGDKDSLFRQALSEFQKNMSHGSERALAEPTLEHALTQFYYQALDMYLPNGTPRGCLLFAVALVDAPTNEAVQREVLRTIQHLDAKLHGRFKRAIDEGELPKSTDAAQLANLATAVLHSLSVRARAGQSRRSLRAFARKSAQLLAA